MSNHPSQRNYFFRGIDGELVEIKMFTNPYHLNTCYLDFQQADIPSLYGSNIFKMISDEVNKPLQIILSSLETNKVDFLSSQGFKKVRVCSEMQVNLSNMITYRDFKRSNLRKTKKGQSDYLECCELQFHYYKKTHVAVNPLTADFQLFQQSLPAKVIYESNHQRICHAAFVEKNEIAYVSSIDEETFTDFALTVIELLFEENEFLIFEVDNVDPIAMIVKNFFSFRIS